MQQQGRVSRLPIPLETMGLSAVVHPHPRAGYGIVEGQMQPTMGTGHHVLGRRKEGGGRWRLTVRLLWWFAAIVSPQPNRKQHHQYDK